MACISCQNNTSIHYVCTTPSCPNCSNYNNNSCYTFSGCNDESTVDSSKVIYTGPDLQCIDVDSNSTVEEVIQAADSKICSIAGIDYSVFDLQTCLVNQDGSQITTAQQFAESVAKYLCNLDTTTDNFITNVYNTFVTNITNQVEGASIPGITGTCTGIIPTDTNAQAFTKVDSTLCSLKASTNTSTANWNNCGFSVGTAPTTPLATVNKLLDYICQVKNLIPAAVTLPTFNNVGSCLPGTLTSTDSLSSTVEKIKTRLCTIDAGSYAALNYGCVNGANNARDALQNTIDRINQFSVYQFDNTYFTLANIDNTYPCQGKTVTLNPTGLDRKVASNNSDTTPGFLVDKLQAGTNVTLDAIGTPGKIVISSVNTGDHKILVNSTDTTADYLGTKVGGASDTSGSITLSTAVNGANNKVIITPAINRATLTNEIIKELQTNPTLYGLFCQLACGCNCGTNKTAQFDIYAETSKSIQFTSQQNNPNTVWYSTGMVTFSNHLTSGTYSITTTSSNPQITLNLQNNGTATVNAHIYVTDLNGNIISASSNITASIVAGATYGNGVFNLGTGGSAYVVHVDLT